MEHSIALVTGATSGLGHAAARLLAVGGYARDHRHWPQPGSGPGNGRSARGGNQKTGLHAAGAGVGHAVQRSVRPRRTRQARSADRFPTAQCRDGPWQGARDHCGGRRGFSGPAHRPSSIDCRVAPRQPAEPQRADRYRQRGTCPRGRTHVQATPTWTHSLPNTTGAT